MQKLEIKGGRKLSGTIIISGSKNATLPIIASKILTNNQVNESAVIVSALEAAGAISIGKTSLVEFALVHME